MTVEEMLTEAAHYEKEAQRLHGSFGSSEVVNTAYTIANNFRLRALCLLAQGYNGE